MINNDIARALGLFSTAQIPEELQEFVKQIEGDMSIFTNPDYDGLIPLTVQIQYNALFNVLHYDFLKKLERLHKELDAIKSEPSDFINNFILMVSEGKL